MSIAWPFDSANDEPIVTIQAPGFPAPLHPAEPDLFCRQTAMPQHDQVRLERAHVGVVGCGGLGSWVAVALARMGVRRLTLMDADVFDRSNAPRQFMSAADLGSPKAHALARHVAAQMTNAGMVTGIALRFSEAVALGHHTPTALIVGVDNNRARLDCARYAHAAEMPAAFAMLSTDGVRAQAFLQRPGSACLACVLPNLDAEAAAPCAAAAMPACLMVAAHVVAMVTSCLMGAATLPTWRETSLDGSTERVGTPGHRARCGMCSPSENH